MRHEYDQRDYYDEEEDGGLDLVDLIFATIRRWKVIVLITVPILLAGIFFAATRPTVYTATVTMMVTNPEETTTMGGAKLEVSNNLIVTYTQLAKSKDIMARVISKYDLPDSPEGLASKVTISPVTGTSFLKISYKNSEPQLTVPVINEIANEFIYKIAQVVRLRNISILENATAPYQLPKNRGVIIVASIILGLGLGCGVAALIELLHKKLRKSSDMGKVLGVKMLGMIPEIDMAKEGEKANE
jgi:capsular polysaccharide biosynthesis protein